MIYTVTLNPSLDYYVTVKDFQTGQVNRTAAERIAPGGKGLNVSCMLRNLDCESVALGFLAGFTGDEIERRVRELGVRTDFLHLSEGFSRINVKLWNDTAAETSGRESEINGKGPVLADSDLETFYKKLDQLTGGDILVLAGSIPSGLPDTVYQDICGKMAERNIRVAVDASGELLRNVLPYKPFLIKPNDKELGELFGCELSTRKDVIPYARELQRMGAVNVLVSLAGEGAVLMAEDGKTYEAAAPHGKVRNSVGAGDSMVAGFLAGYISGNGNSDCHGDEAGVGNTADASHGADNAVGDRHGNGVKTVCEHAFRLGLCAGSASAFSEGLADGEAVRSLSEQIQIHAADAR